MTRARTHLILAAATLLLFAIANVRAPLANEDSVLYVLVAQRIAEQGFSAAFELFDRPFYSALIAFLHHVTGLSAVDSARVLNAGLSVLLVGAFAEFCRLLHRDARLLPWAGMLLLAHPKLVNYFALLVRDLGYWALLLASFCALLLHLGDGARRWLALWAVCVLGATVFKPEAIAWGLLVPPGLLFVPPRPLARRALDATLAMLAVAVPAFAAAVAFRVLVAPGAAAVPDMAAVPRDVLMAVMEGFGGAVDRYAAAVLDPFSRHVAGISLAGGLLVILAAKVLNALGPVQILALVVGHRRVTALAPMERAALLVVGLPALLLPAVFVAYRQFLDTRYVMLPMLLLLALAVPCVRSLFESARERLHGRTAPALLAVILVFGADLALGLDRPKPYMLACVEWLRQEVDPSTRVFSNDVQLAAASGARWDWNEAHHAEQRLESGWVPEDAEYWILHERDERAVLPALEARVAGRYTTVRVFEDGRGDRIRVLHRRGTP